MPRRVVRADGQWPRSASIRTRITLLPAVEGFDGSDILLADGTRTQADVVIAATGYRHGLAPLVGHRASLTAV